MKDLPGFETHYEVAARCYDGDRLICAIRDRFMFKVNAIDCAKESLDIFNLNPCNISVRGHDGRFIKWKN